MKQRRSASEHDLHSVSIRPRYLIGEFFCVYVMVVYASVVETQSAINAGRTIPDANDELQLTTDCG